MTESVPASVVVGLAPRSDDLFDSRNRHFQNNKDLFRWQNAQKSESWDRVEVKEEEVIVALRSPCPDGSSILLAVSRPPADDKKTPPRLVKVLRPQACPLVQRYSIAHPLQHWQQRHENGKEISNGSSSPNVHIVVSTGSGTGQAESVWQSLLQPLLAQLDFHEGSDYQVLVTTSDSSVTDFTVQTVLPRANEGTAQQIVLLSGDGGVVDMVNALLSGSRKQDIYCKPNIALLPLGTGNALANSSGIAGQDATLGLRTLLHGDSAPLPLFRAKFSPGARLLIPGSEDDTAIRGFEDNSPVAYGAVVASWGLHAGLVADSDTPEYRKFGAERFGMAARAALYPADGGPPHAYRGKVSIRRPDHQGNTTWETVQRDLHGYVLATLVSQLEAGFTVSPESRPLDGRLRLVHFGALGADETVEVMGKAYAGGKHAADERVSYEEIEAVRIEMEESDPRWRRVCIDGKTIRVEEGGWVEVEVQREEVARVLKLVVKEKPEEQSE